MVHCDSSVPSWTVVICLCITYRQKIISNILHTLLFSGMNFIFFCLFSDLQYVGRNRWTGQYVYNIHSRPWLSYWAVWAGERKVHAIRVWYQSSFLCPRSKCGGWVLVSSWLLCVYVYVATRRILYVHISSCIVLASKWRHKVLPILTDFLLIFGRKICLLRKQNW